MDAVRGVTLDGSHQMIVDATVELLGERGYVRLTMDEIAQRAHVGKATIYRRWPSKLPLVIDAVRQTGAIDLPTPDTGRLDTDFAAFVEVLIGVLGRPLGRALVRLLADAAPDPELRHVVYDELLRRRQATLRTILERAVSRGEVREDADVEMVVELCFAAVYHRLVISDQDLDLPYGERVAELLLRGLRPA